MEQDIIDYYASLILLRWHKKITVAIRWAGPKKPAKILARFVPALRRALKNLNKKRMALKGPYNKKEAHNWLLLSIEKKHIDVEIMIIKRAIEMYETRTASLSESIRAMR